MGARKQKIPTIKATDIDTSVVDVPNVPSDAILIPGDGLALRASKRELKAIVAKFQTVVDRKSTMPILANVSLRVDESGLTITGTDLHTSLRMRLEGNACKAIRPGSVSVPAKRLADVIKALPDGEITMSTAKTTMVVSSGTATSRIEGMHDRDTPKFPSFADDVTWSDVDASALVEIIEATKHAICTDETRFHLNGTLLECRDGTLRAVTTDGHRLAKAERTISGDLRITSALLRRKGAIEIAKLLAKSKGTCGIAATKSHVWIKQGETVLVTALVDAQYPPYEQVIPKGHERLVTVDASVLAEALSRAKVNCSETRGVVLSLASGKLVVVASDPDSGEFREEIEADYSCRETRWGVNPGYLIDSLAEIDGKVVLAVNNELDPMLVRSLDDAAMRSVLDASFLSVVMPMRI